MQHQVSTLIIFFCIRAFTFCHTCNLGTHVEAERAAGTLVQSKWVVTVVRVASIARTHVKAPIVLLLRAPPERPPLSTPWALSQPSSIWMSVGLGQYLLLCAVPWANVRLSSTPF